MTDISDLLDIALKEVERLRKINQELIEDVIKELKNHWEEYYWIILETKEEVISKENYDKFIEKLEKRSKTN